MSINLMKLAVGVEDVEHLRSLQQARVRGGKKTGRWKTHTACPRHITRMRPRREDELLGGGSIYWVIRGSIRARQKIIALEDVDDTGPGIGPESRPVRRTALVLDPELVPTRPLPQRPFQGWRYLDGARAPADAPEGAGGQGELPDKMARELEELGLL